MNKKNIILVDWIPKEEWIFKKYLEEFTLEKWEVGSVKANGRQNNILIKFIGVYSKYFIYPIIVFLKRNDYKNVIAEQQFFGLILAFYCSLFKVKYYPKIIIMTFIYKPKKGLLKSIYFNFIKYIVQSKYISKIICFSESEEKYYTELFKLSREKVEFCLYSQEDESELNLDYINEEQTENRFFLSVGRSNRDYKYLIDSVKDCEYKVVILCDNLSEKEYKNIEIKNNVFGDEYIDYMKRCYAVIIPLEDENVSSGQLVFLKAMQFGKPVIITKNNTVNSYIKNNYNGIIINKNAEELLSAMKLLNDDTEVYKKISNNSVKFLEENLTLKSFVRAISKIINDK